MHSGGIPKSQLLKILKDVDLNLNRPSPLDASLHTNFSNLIYAPSVSLLDS